MKKLVLFLFLFILNSINIIYGQTNIWDGSSNDNWNTGANWSLGVPTNEHNVIINMNASIDVDINTTINSLTINNSAMVSLTSSGGQRTISIDNSGSSIGSGSTLTLQGSNGSGTRSMGIAFSGNNRTMLISGTLVLTSAGDGTFYNATNSITTVTGTLRNSETNITSTSSNLLFSTGSVYEHALNGGTIPTATWDAASNLNITGMTSNYPNNMDQTFGNVMFGGTNLNEEMSENLSCLGNLTLNYTSTSDHFSMTEDDNRTITVGGNFLKQGTGQLIGSTGNGNVTITVGGNFLKQGTGQVTGSTNNGNVTITVNGNFSLETGTFLGKTNNGIPTITVGGNFLMTGGTMQLRNTSSGGVPVLNVAGDFSATGGIITTTDGASSINFNGNNNQSITTTGTISNTINFSVNKSSGNVVLNSNLQINGSATLTMTQGNVDLNSNTLTLGTGSTNQTRGTLDWTSGFLTGAGTFTRWFSGANISIGNIRGLFPMGSGNSNRSVWVSGNPETGGTVSVQHSDQTGELIVPEFEDGGVTIDRRHNMNWTLSTANGFANTNAGLRIQGTGIPGITIVSELRLIREADAVGTSLNGTGNATNPQVNRTGLSAANLNNTFYFGGNSGNNPLPVELSSFTALPKGNDVILNWETKIEVQNYGFEIERSQISNIKNQTEWDNIGFVKGHGNSNSPKKYSFVDNKLTSGKYFYRLKQIDTDGGFEYSKVVEVDFSVADNFGLEQNYPNPFNPVTTIKFAFDKNTKAQLKIYDVLGNEVANLFNETIEAGKIYEVDFNASGLSSGVYYYQISGDSKTEIKKMILLK